MATRTVVLIPSNGTNITQSGQVFPGTFVQPSGYIQYGGQQLGISHNAPEQIPRMRALEKLCKEEAKTLGAIQIMIGLIHIGLGALSFCFIFSHYYTPLTGFAFYPLWGGVFFVASGSFCVASVKNPNHYLVKCSVGMNTTSAAMASIGIILLIAELAFNQVLIRAPYNPEDQAIFELSKFVGIRIAVLLLLFSFLQFCITVSAAHFGCQATCCNSDPESMVFVPYQVSGSMEDSAESNLPAPPEYDSVDSASKAH